MTKIAFLINAECGGALDQRARAFAERLAGRYDVRMEYRAPQKLAAILRFFIFLARMRPAVTYVFDMSYSGVLGASLYKLLFRNRLVIETGDAIYELARASGMRGRLGLWLTWLLEEFSLHVADRIVVRGTFHQRHLAECGIEADVIQDGVDTEQFKPQEVSALRLELGLDGVLTVGLVGTSVWSERLQWCYGRELVETIRLLKDLPVVGAMIGTGSGIERLKALCAEYDITDRVRFWGYLPYDELPRRLNLLDICLSTQTNNLAGQVRTTGKLPLYLATGRYVLASAVGEALLLLPLEMLVVYEGEKDELYPRRVAEKIRALLKEPEKLHRAMDAVTLARQHFEYQALTEKLACVLASVLRVVVDTPQAGGLEKAEVKLR
jgi:glycosyltransferase involved in cell wall biosynthesis